MFRKRKRDPVVSTRKGKGRPIQKKERKLRGKNIDVFEGKKTP